MIDNWPAAGAIVGSVAIVVGAIIRVFAGNKQKDDQILSALLKNQADQTRILDRLSLLMEHGESRTEELHKDTHQKLNEVTTNQRAIHQAIIEVGHRLKPA